MKYSTRPHKLSAVGRGISMNFLIETGENKHTYMYPCFKERGIHFMSRGYVQLNSDVKYSITHILLSLKCF